MLPATARFAVALTLLALVIGFTYADDETDPEYEGMKLSEWKDRAQNGKTARQRALAVEALGKIWTLKRPKAEVIPYIGTRLKSDPSSSVRTQAAIALGSLRPEDKSEISPYLIGALEKEKESGVRKEIILAMMKHPDICAKGIEPLIDVLKDPDAAVKIAAAEAIALVGIDPKAKEKAKSAAPGLVPLLKDENKAVRLAGVYALGRIEPEGASTLAETMSKMLATEKEAEIKRELVTSIGLLGEKTEMIVKSLGAALFDTDEEVRRRAARVLGTFGTAAGSVADDLFKAITMEKATDIRVDTVRAYGSALGPMGVKSKLKVIRTQLDPTAQPAYEVRLALVEEIAALGWEHLGVDLTSPDKAVKEEALETIDALRKRGADPQINVREAAKRAIRVIQTKPEPKKEEPKKEEPKKEQEK